MINGYKVVCCGATPTSDLKDRTPSDLAMLYKLAGLEQILEALNPSGLVVTFSNK